MILNNLQIKIKDFKSIANTEWISLDGKIVVFGKNFIDGGSNGSGKSSILEALYVSVSLCEISEKAEEQKQLKKYYRETKYPFEIFVKFKVGNENFEIKATPDGIKIGSSEAKKYLYTLITSFLMQGMTNSLIKQEASDCKSIISSYFECDEIINNIIQNSEVVKTKLEEKLKLLEENKKEFDNIFLNTNFNKDNYTHELKRLESEKLELQSKLGSSIAYNEQEHNEILDKIKKAEKFSDEISDLYKEKYSLSNGVDSKIKELKKQKNDIIEKAESLYIRTIGNKFGAFIKRATREYNDEQKKEYDRKNNLAIEEKKNKSEELNIKIKELEKLEAQKTYISNEQREFILSWLSKYTNLISKEIEIKIAEDETDNLYKGILDIVKSTVSKTKEKLQEELRATKKSSVKKFQEIEITVYTLNNKPKKKLPDYYIVYSWDIKTNNKFIVENTATMIDFEKFNIALQEIEDYQAPDTNYLDKEINELENTDAGKKLTEIENRICEKEILKVNTFGSLEDIRAKEKEFNERKIKSALYAEDNKKYLLLEANIVKTKESIEQAKQILKDTVENLSKTTQKIERWNAFLNEINNDLRLVKNSFKDYIIDLYNDRLEPLIDFYSSKVFNLNSKLVIKIGSKTKQPSLNGIKFEHTSGGEKSKALFVFSLAHRDYLSKQRGFNNNYIFCDEVFDGMDEKSRQQSIQFLTQGLVMENVLVISHMEDTTLPYFKKITVIKNESGTNIK